MGCFKEFTVGFAKYILFLFNLIILIAAALFIAFAVKYKENNAGFDLKSVSTYAIIVGVLIALIAFFGCCGAVRESSCMLTTYAVILIIIFLVQLVLGILAFIAIKNDDNQLRTEIDKHLGSLYEKYSTDGATRDLIDQFQRNLECCGRTGTSDPEVQNVTTGGLILSCCPSSYTQCSSQSKDVYKDGCTSKMTDFFQSSIKVLGIVAITFGVVELLAAIFACYEECKLRTTI